MDELRLSRSDATSAAEIQQAIDALGPSGGRVVLPAMELELDRGIELRANVALVGQGRQTVLHKAPGKVYPLSGYHNYGMYDVPLVDTVGLVPGMTVAVRDDQHGGFFETFARITWVEAGWVGLDRGLDSDYHVAHNPVLVTAFPMIFGRGVSSAALEGVTLDGNREAQPAGIGACRGAAVYFIGSRELTVTDVVETGFAGEGLGFQMCRDVAIQDCVVTRNAGNGFHPGAGSTGALFDGCIAEDNDAAGFFFCVRANHITVRNCRFAESRGAGVSIGTRDSYNLLETCIIEGNNGAGILFRDTPSPVAPHTLGVRGCRIEGNGRSQAQAQIGVLGDAHDIVIERNSVHGLPGVRQAGVHAAPTVRRLWLADNEIHGCTPELAVDAASRAGGEPVLACGIEAVQPDHYRHLSTA